MAEPPPRPKDQPEIADVNWLLRDTPEKTQATPPAGSTPPQAADPGEGYAVEGLDPAPADDAPPVPRSTPPPPPRAPGAEGPARCGPGTGRTRTVPSRGVGG